MSHHDDAIRLRHMLKHAVEARDLVLNRKREDLDADRMLNLALVRLLEIIGEAAARVSTQAQNLYPFIPWPEIISLRNRLIHGYDKVDFDILWSIVVDDLPPLIRQLETILASESG